MSQYKNEIVLVGKAIKDKEGNVSKASFTPNGAQVVRFQVNVPYETKNPNGTKQERNSYFYISAWGKAGENVSATLTEGALVEVKGFLQNRSWTDKVTNKKVYRLEISAREVALVL